MPQEIFYPEWGKLKQYVLAKRNAEPEAKTGVAGTATK
jgi:hypothetical protein